MRVLAIRGRNLASIAGDFAVDFEAEPLAGSGIFAITGPTGAGKSTLLDAVTLALFNDIPRLRAAPDRSQVGDGDTLSAKDSRAVLRHGTGEGFAEVDFAMPDGARYRARWSVKRARLKPEGRIQNYDHAFERLDSPERLGGTRTETLAAIRDVIGLSAEQFGRAVLLAQGDFEAFIRADANDRALLLERLTGSAIYARLGQRAWEKAAALRSDLEAIRRDIAAQHGLGDDERADAQARHDAALADERAAGARLAELTLARQWEQRAAELALRITHEESAEADAQAAVLAAEPRRAALTRDRAAFGFAGAWQALAAAAQARDAAADGLAQASHALEQARAQDAGAALHEQDALARHAGAEAEAALLAPDIASARALDQQLAAAAGRRDAQAAETKQRRDALALAVEAEAEARLAHDLAHAAHRDHLAWLAAHAAWHPLAPRETELADSLAALAGIEAARAGKVQERAGQLTSQEDALTRWSAAQSALATADNDHALRAAALATAEAALPPPGRLAELTATRDALVAIERLLGDLGHAQDRAALAETTLAATRTRQAAIIAREAEMHVLASDLADTLPALRARQEEARRACALADAAADEVAQLLRDKLEDGQPCPVCGATEHRLTALDALLGEQHVIRRNRADECDAAVLAHQRQAAETDAERRTLAEQAQTLAKDLAEQARALDTALAQRDGIAADLAARTDRASLPAAAEPLAAALTIQREATDRDLAALSAAQAAATRARQSELQARGQRDAARTGHAAAHDALQALTRALTETDRDLAELDRRHESLALSLDHALAPLGDWRALANPLGALREAAAAWRTQVQGRDTSAEALPARDAALALAKGALATTQARADAADEALVNLGQAHVTLAEARSALLDGETTHAVAHRLEAARTATAQALDAARTARAVAAQDRAGAEARDAAALTRRDEAASDHTAHDTALADQLAAAGLLPGDVARVTAAGQAALEAEAAALAVLDSALGERRAVLARCREDRAAHEAGERPPLQESDLAEALAAATALRDAAAGKRGEEAFALRRDDEVREHTTQLRARLERESAAADIWLKLSDLIGDATGNKFRRFAQGLTLDRLLDHANARLADLKPRYTLQRGAGGDMLIQVIDNDMAGEVRGLHNLSGGERFLVSLALALGLAEMSTANGVRIESLFIDEGFGALDPASLGQAVALLEHLHATGRRVGVISHVEELKERIAVKIEVTPTGRGTSAISVVAG